MNIFESLITQALFERIGWTIIHSLWQGLLIGLLAGLVLILLRRYSARTRYFVLLIAMSAVLFSAVTTFMVIPSAGSDQAPQTGINREASSSDEQSGSIYTASEIPELVTMRGQQ